MYLWGALFLLIPVVLLRGSLLHFPLSAGAFLVAVTALTVAVALAWWRGRLRRTGCSLEDTDARIANWLRTGLYSALTAFSFIPGIWFGKYEAARTCAFTDDLVPRLAAYKAREGTYPASLDALLKPDEFPRILRRGIATYHSDGRSFYFFVNDNLNADIWRFHSDIGHWEGW